MVTTFGTLGQELVDDRQVVVVVDSASAVQAFSKSGPMFLGEGGVVTVPFVA